MVSTSVHDSGRITAVRYARAIGKRLVLDLGD